MNRLITESLMRLMEVPDAGVDSSSDSPILPHLQHLDISIRGVGVDSQPDLDFSDQSFLRMVMSRVKFGSTSGITPLGSVSLVIMGRPFTDALIDEVVRLKMRDLDIFVKDALGELDMRY